MIFIVLMKNSLSFKQWTRKYKLLCTVSRKTMSNITDTGALLTVNIVSTSILMCFGAKQLADLFHYDMRTKTDPYLWWIKTLCSLWAIINAVGLFLVFRTDLNDSSCNIFFAL